MPAILTNEDGHGHAEGDDKAPIVKNVTGTMFLIVDNADSVTDARVMQLTSGMAEMQIQHDMVMQELEAAPEEDRLRQLEDRSSVLERKLEAVLEDDRLNQFKDRISVMQREVKEIQALLKRMRAVLAAHKVRLSGNLRE
jgi:hypothetical protein